MDILKEILSEANEQPMFEQEDKSFTQDEESAGSQPETKEADPSQEGEQSTTTESEAEAKPEESEDNTPDDKPQVRLDKIPRFKEVIKQRNEEREARERLEQELAEIKQMLQGKKEESNVPQWFVEQYAEHDNVNELWNVYQTENQRAIEEAARKANELRAQEEQSREAEVEAQRKWIDEQLGALSEETGVNFSDPNIRYKFLKVVDDYKPTDDDGNFDFEKAYKIYSVLEKENNTEQSQKTQARKEIAAQTTTDSQPAPVEKKVLTSEDIRKAGDLWGLLKSN